ncbi:MAG TPA: aminotransferase class V-fold PLP-dependent enzyme [Thermoanaerobaculia bacterium]|nr:aminotransferase class V-fold PLP-dependent enzyme [Thermoanaerobaculia bacterium]
MKIIELVDEPLLDRAHQHALEFLKALPDRHVGATATRDELLRALSIPFSDGGESPSAVLDALAREAPRATSASAGPRYFGFVIGGSLPVTLATDWLISAWDQNSGIFSTSPLVSVAEEIASRWVLDLLALPAESSVGFVTGGQMANFTCLAAARHAVLKRVGWNVEDEGLVGAPPINLIVSAEAHITILTSLRMLGLGTRALQRVDTDAQGRMKPRALEARLATASGPTIVCAQAGNVNTGAFDPLRAIGEAARTRNAWVHIDGAFGLWASASRDRQFLTDGVELADSWATDAHKWLNVPYDCGMAIVRDSASHRASMTLTAPYLEQTRGSERDAIDWSPEFSRRARGVTVYAALRTLGRRGVEELIDRSCAQARQMAELLGENPRVELLHDVVLNQVLVRFKSKFVNTDEFTRRVITKVQQDGTCWLAGSTWHDMAAMRISFSNWSTSESDVARSAAAILSSIEAAD